MTKHTLDKILAGDPKVVLERFLTATDTGQRFLAEIEDQRTADRRAIAKQLKDAAAKHRKELGELEQRQQAANAAHEEAQRLLHSTAQQLSVATGALFRSITLFDRTRRELESKLLALVDPRIVEFRRWLETEGYRARRPRTPARANDAGMAELRAAVAARIRAINAAIPEVEAMYLEPLSSDEIAERLAEIHQRIAPELPGMEGALVGYATTPRREPAD